MLPVFKKGDKVRFYYNDYHMNPLFSLLGINGIFTEIYNKDTGTYYNLEFFPANDKYFKKDLADLVCYETTVQNNMAAYTPVYYYRSSSVFSDYKPPKKIIYKLTQDQADLINSYITNKSYPKYYSWFFSNNTDTSNDWDFVYDIFEGLSTHIDGTFQNKLDDFLSNVV